MAWSRLKAYFDPVEFVIDERPLPVHREQETEATRQSEAGEAPAANGRPHYFGRKQTDDIVHQISELLVEQVRLIEHARHLERGQAQSDEFERFARQVLPFVDNFSHLLDMARESQLSGEAANWLRSVEALYFRIISLLESFGLTFIDSQGKVVDLDYHEVVEYRRTNRHPHNTVIKDVQKGVVYRGRLMRDAKVIVACNE